MLFRSSFGTSTSSAATAGISIVGGLVVSQLLTLYTTPVVYLYVDRARTWFQKVKIRLGLSSGEKDDALAPV